MVAAPAALSLAGIILCSFYFYRRKLKLPLQLLSDATARISAQDLDFRPEYDCDDEMGGLCRSFVQMQDALRENSRKMWAMLEERKNLQASVSHDLRNPIAIIQGYGEHLANKAEKRDLSPENALRIARNISLAAKRMENYAESLHTLNQLEDITARRQEMSALALAADLTEVFSLMAQQNHRILHVASKLPAHTGNAPVPAPDPSYHDLSKIPAHTDNAPSGVSPCAENETSLLPDVPVRVDQTLLYRILENIVGNALRFSREDIFLDLWLESGTLSITIRDDGEGYPKNVLQKDGKTFFPSSSPSGQGNHMGIGIAVSRILCHKHGGTLRLSNAPCGGAMTEITIDVS